jgi:hypothetical protein
MIGSRTRGREANEALTNYLLVTRPNDRPFTPSRGEGGEISEV